MAAVAAMVAAHTLLHLLAPILVFSTEEAWHELSRQQGLPPRRLALGDWPGTPAAWQDSPTAASVEALLSLRDQVNEKLEVLRGEKVIGKSIEAALTLTGSPRDPVFAACQRFSTDLPELFIVSTVLLQESPTAESIEVSAHAAAGDRCPRCWRTVTELHETAHGSVCPRCAHAVAES